MTIEEYTPLGESGSLESQATFDAWVDSGFVDERVRYTRLNRQLNRADVAVNDIIRQGIKTSKDGAAGDIHTKNFWDVDNAFAKSSDASNNFLFPNHSGAIYDLCYCNSTTRGKIILVSGYTRVDGFDIVSETDLGQILTISQLQAGLPAAFVNPGVVAICCDSDYVYCTIVYSTQTPRVQSYSIADGSVNPSWPAEGLQLTAGAVAYDPLKEVKIKWVADDKLAVCQPWVDVTSGTADAIVVINSADGTELGDGAGDFAGSTGQCVGVCGNGSYAFFVIQEAGQATVCSMDLSTYGNTGCGGTGWPFVNIEHDADEFGDISCAGHTVVTTWLDGPEIQVFDDEEGELFSSSSADTTTLSGLGRMAYTGLDWWAVGFRNTTYKGIFRLDCVNRFGNSDETTSVNLDEHVKAYGDFRRDSLTTFPQRYGVAYDGRDFWYLGRSNAVDLDWVLARLPRVNVR